MNDEGAGEPHPLTHSARKLLWIGALITVEADEIDGGERPLMALLWC
jgi:hypothetical protein